MRPIDSFKESMESVKTLHALHGTLCEKLPAMDISEILRAEVVLLVSALDCFIHDVVRKGLMEIFNDKNKNISDRLSITLSTTKQMLLSESDTEKQEVLETAIKQILSKQSYQSSHNIEDALQLISVSKPWSSIEKNMGIKAEDIKKQLGVVIRRRNQIAHESDRKNLMGERNDIERGDIDEMICFISKLAECINLHCINSGVYNEDWMKDDKQV